MAVLQSTGRHEIGVELAGAIRIPIEQRQHPASGEKCRPRPFSDRGVVAAPLPLARGASDPGANRIENDVARQFEQVDVAFDELVVKAALEEVSVVPVAPVEPPRVDPVQPLHALGDIRARGLDEEVVVIRHQAIRVAAPAKQLYHLFEQLEESEPVAGVGEDLLSAVSTTRYVVGRAGGLDARRARHLPTVAAGAAHARAWHPFGTEAARLRWDGTCPGARHDETPRAHAPR
jgi:hypothetical protein